MFTYAYTANARIQITVLLKKKIQNMKETEEFNIEFEKDIWEEKTRKKVSH